MPVASRPHDNPATDAADLLTLLGLTILMIGLPLAGIFSKSAIYSLLPIGAVLVFLGSVLESAEHGTHHLRGVLISRGSVVGLFLVGWTSLSLLWTPFPGEASEHLLKGLGTLALVALVGIFLPSRTKPRHLSLLPIGLGLTIVAVLAMLLIGPASFRTASEFDESLFERSVLTLTVLVWPALGALALRERWISAALLAVLVAVVAIAGRAQITLAALGAGAFTFAIAMSAPAKTARVLVCLFVPLILFAPAIPLLVRLLHQIANLPLAPQSSLALWAELLDHDGIRLLTGHGADLASRAMSLGYLPPNTPKTLLFLIWYDLGIIGALSFALLTALALLKASRLSIAIAPALLGGCVVVLTIAILGLATIQVWWVSLLGCDIIAFLLLLKSPHRLTRPVATDIEAFAEEETAGPPAPPNGAPPSWARSPYPV
ncbi:hypothetical protein [Beijerinckia indica]|nr:hypothetical protein [Beijerinckia indica]